MSNETHAEHHPGYGFYVAIYFVLAILLAVSVLFGTVSPFQAVLLAFTVAFIKAYLVVMYYMHLKYEPKWILGIMLSGVLAVWILFGGVAADVFSVKANIPPIP